MKKKIVLTIALLLALTGCGRREDDGIIRKEWSHTYEGHPVVYVAPEVSADGLLSAYESLEASFDGTAAIKLSRTNKDKGFAWTELIEELSDSLDEPVVVETLLLWIFLITTVPSFCHISEAMTQQGLMER